jgi:hypothetical protein
MEILSPMFCVDYMEEAPDINDIKLPVNFSEMFSRFSKPSSG